MSDPPVDSPDSLPDWIMPWPSFDVDWTRTALLIVDMQGCHSKMLAKNASGLVERPCETTNLILSEPYVD